MGELEFGLDTVMQLTVDESGRELDGGRTLLPVGMHSLGFVAKTDDGPARDGRGTRR